MHNSNTGRFDHNIDHFHLKTETLYNKNSTVVPTQVDGGAA